MRPKGVFVINTGRVSILAILVINRDGFCTNLEMGTCFFFTGSYFFTVDKIMNKSPHSALHRTKSHVSVFLKRGGNMQLHGSVIFTSCGNVKIQICVIPSRLRNGNVKSRFRHI